MDVDDETVQEELHRRTLLLKRGGSKLQPCCRGSAELHYERYRQRFHAEDRPDLCAYILFAGIDRAVPSMWDLFELIEVRVMSSRPFLSAWMARVICVQCQHAVPLVAVNANLLLLLWRIMMVHIGRIRDWNLNTPGRMKVEYRPPTADDVEQLRLAVEMYLNGAGITEAGLESLLTAHRSANETSKAVFLEALELAELWIVLHECGHFLPDLVSVADDPYFAGIDRFAASCVVDLDALPMLQRYWLQEHRADLCATLSLLVAAVQGPLFSNDPEPDRLHNAAQLTLAAVAAAMESLNFIEAAYSSRAMTDLPKHPPTVRRYSAVEQFVLGTVPHQDDESIGAIANLLAAMSSEMMEKVFE
jgi:hypothetical protein